MPESEITYVRADKLDELLDDVMTVAFDAGPTTGARLVRAIDRFHAPHIPDVDVIIGGDRHCTVIQTERQSHFDDYNLPGRPSWATNRPDGVEMYEMCIKVVSRWDPPEPASYWSTGEFEAWKAGLLRFEEWWVYDFHDFGGPVLGWPDEERDPAIHGLRFWGDDVETPSVMLKIYEHFRSLGAREPSEWIADVVKRSREGWNNSWVPRNGPGWSA
jgi:hypothetical protein